MNREKRLVLAVSLIAIGMAFLSAYSHELLLVATGALVFGGFVCLAINERWIKAVLPYYLFLLLLQDTLKASLDLYVPILGTMVNYLDEAFLAVCLVALAVHFLNGKKIIGLPVLAVIGLMLILGAVSAFLNNVPLLIAMQGAFLMTKGVLYLFVFMNLSFTEKDVSRYVAWLKGIAIAVVLFALTDMAIGPTYRELLNITYVDFEARGIVTSVVSFFTHPGLYGWFMVFIGIYGLSAFVVKKDRRFLFIAAGFFLFAFLSFRFKVLLAVLVVLGVLYMLGGLKKALVYLLPLLFVGSLAYFAGGQYAIGLTVSTIENYITAEIGDSARKALYVTAVDIGKENFPFGEGFGRFGGHVSMVDYSPVYEEYGIHTTYGLSQEEPDFITDTYWPNIPGELGFAGAVVVFFLYLYLILKLLYNYPRAETEAKRIFILFAGLIMVQALVESLGEPIFNSAPQNVFVFITLGIAFSFLSKISIRR